ncbi:hypothetical protein PSR1_03147 [Anaeromyxobacter sp. PSR-1]|nr:hypothetical protein PSR1_03147 [Anaeromyxobacter sp. PSR-1]
MIVRVILNISSGALVHPPRDPVPSPATAEPACALVCTRCGAVVAIDPDLGALAASAASRNGFEVRAPRLRLFGCCAACRAGAAGPLPRGWGRA